MDTVIVYFSFYFDSVLVYVKPPVRL